MYDAVPDFGWLYDQVPAYAARPDVAFYLDEAARVPGRATLLQCDIRDLAIPATATAKTGPNHREGFALAMAPFRILQHLITTTDQLRCLASIRRQLAANGRFVFDVFNPNFAAMVTDRSAEAEDTPEFELPDGRYFRRTVRVLRVRWTDQVSDVELIYYLRRGTAVERVVQRFEMRWYLVAELEHLLARAGFALESVCGDFARAPLEDASPEIVMVASVQPG